MHVKQGDMHESHSSVAGFPKVVVGQSSAATQFEENKYVEELASQLRQIVICPEHSSQGY